MNVGNKIMITGFRLLNLLKNKIYKRYRDFELERKSSVDMMYYLNKCNVNIKQKASEYSN